MLINANQFLSSEQRCEPKNLDAALNITGVEKTLGKLAAAVNRLPFASSLNERSVSDDGNLCFLWLVFSNQFDIV